MSSRSILKKPLFWTNLVVLILFSFAVADVIFGWTNPPSDPPNPPGAVRAVNSEVGIGTDPVIGSALSVAGKFNLLDNEGINFNWPTASSSAASKGYVDAQAGGIPGLSLILFGEASTTVASGLPLPGGNLSCSTLGANYVEAYRGYGPHWIGIDTVYGPDGFSSFVGGNDFGITDVLNPFIAIAPSSAETTVRIAYASDSVCSSVANTVIPVEVDATQTISGMNEILRADAKACAKGVAFSKVLNQWGDDGYYYCNVCVSCYRDT
jgi:hypothetical protein